MREEFLLRNTWQKVSILRNLGIISRGLRVSSFSDDEKWDYLLIKIEHKRMFHGFRAQLDLHPIDSVNLADLNFYCTEAELKKAIELHGK